MTARRPRGPAAMADAPRTSAARAARRVHRAAAAFVAASCVATLVSCNDPAPRGAEPMFPKIRDIAPPPASRPATRPDEITARVYRLELPLRSWVDAMWGQTRSDGLDAAALSRWRANGLRAGLLDEARGHAFIASLPPADQRTGNLAVTAEVPAPMYMVPPLRGSTRYRLCLPPEGERLEAAARGRFQVLTALTRSEGGGLVAEITPHLHFNKARVVPLDAFEALRDGRVFAKLSLRAQVPAGAMLVLGVDPETIPPEPPPMRNAKPEAAPPEPASADDAEPRDASPPDESDLMSFPRSAPGDTPRDPADAGVFDEKEAPPPTLGELIFTARQGRRAVQFVLVIAPRERGGATAATQPATR